MLQSLEWKQGYSGWGMPTLDYSDIPSPFERAQAEIPSSTDVKQAKRSPALIPSSDMQKQAPVTKIQTSTPSSHLRYSSDELLEMAHGLE